VSRYPLTSDAVRERATALLDAPDSPDWIAFARDVLRVPSWMRPAVQAAVESKVWVTAADPLEAIRNSVRRFAIDMKLNNSEKRVLVDLDAEE
jgi:hypothetical protein